MGMEKIFFVILLTDSLLQEIQSALNHIIRATVAMKYTVDQHVDAYQISECAITALNT